MFPGRSVEGIENRLFGGINELSNVLNVKRGYALDMSNFEIDPTDAVRRRDGFQVVSTIGTKMRYLGTYFTTGGTQIFVAVVDNKFYESNAIAGPWVDQTGTVTLSDVDGPWIGTDIGGKFLLTNGTDAPIISSYGASIKTLKNASQINAPGALGITYTGTVGAQTFKYAVTAITARGETTPQYISIGGCVTPLTITDYVTLTWNLVAGAIGYKVYSTIGASNNYFLKATLGQAASSYTDSSANVTNTPNPPITNTAYNTPTIWDTTPPSGFITIAKGRSQRVIAFRGGYMWACALSDPLNWLTPNDAFDQPIYGGKDNNIIAGTSLYDYTLLCSKTNTFVFTGSTYTDFTLSKILNVGCVAPHSFVSAGDNVYFWSEVGPNSFARVMTGQDIQTTPGMNNSVQNTVSSLSNRAYWSKIVAWNHLRNNRLAWAYPDGTSTDNNKAILYGYSGEPNWSRHAIGAVVNAVTDTLRINYVGTTDGKVYQLYSGNNDNGSSIQGFYETGWYDSQSFLNRRINWLDIVMDKTAGSYSLNVSIFWDMATTTNSNHVITDTLTDGIPVAISTPTANIHRIYPNGFGRYFKFRFSTTSPDSATAPRILGWRPEMSSKGTR